MRAVLGDIGLGPYKSDQGPIFLDTVPNTNRFSGSGIWLFSRSGSGILEGKGSGIRGCSYEQDTGFGDFKKRDSGSVTFRTEIRFGRFRELEKDLNSYFKRVISPLIIEENTSESLQFFK